jgi:starvation-inducible DNA-binding protein
MLKILTESHEQVLRKAREVLRITQTSMDESTASLVSDLMRIHEKTVWMLRAMTKP